MYLTSLLPLELEGVSETAQPKQLQDRILYAVCYGPKVSVTGTILRTKNLKKYNALKQSQGKKNSQ